MTGRALLGGPSRRLVLFGDPVGLPQLLRIVKGCEILAIVGATIRPQQHGAIAALAHGVGASFLVQPRAHDSDHAGFRSRLATLAPDLLVVNSYSMILQPDVLAVSRHGAVNVHGALLPAYRGANVTEWALINGARETGATIHVMDSGIDTGPVIAQRRVPIGFEDTWLDVRRRVVAATEGLLEEAMPAILAGHAEMRPQDRDGAQYWSRRKAADGAFTWDWSTIAIYNHVRALVAPHPGASVDGVAVDSWLSVPEVVWRKFRAGRGAWHSTRWQLVPQMPRPKRSRRLANAVLPFDVRNRAGGTVGWVHLSGISDAPSPLRAVLGTVQRVRGLRGTDAELRALVGRVAADEFGRGVVFAEPA
jgi:methionyl-tRNA formyltransferase